MGRYYFHIRVGQTVIRDEEGMECRDVIAAQAEAASSLRDMALQAAGSGILGAPATIEIEDEDGNCVSEPVAKRVLH